MRRGQSSRSAEGVALIRAIEAGKPEGSRICHDPLAGRLIRGGFAFAVTKWVVTSGLYERMAPGAAAFIAVRERYVDDFLRSGLDEGLEQVVILGAGFDTRPYRTPGIERTRVFEIDTPATQKTKLERLKNAIDPLPAHVRFLPADFNTPTLCGRLQNSDYNPSSRTLFIWQGVTYFLTAEGVDDTLAFIANHSGPGSCVIFDYMYREVFRDPKHSYAKALRRAAKVSGEAYMFGIERGQVESFLAERGFGNVLNKTLEDLAEMYLTGPNAGRPIPTGMAIASARVKTV
jgi:methyltransferase (TIGR00027 family)